MGLIAASGGHAGDFKSDVQGDAGARRLRSHEPRELISGRIASVPIAKAQAYLAIGAGLIGSLAVLLPHPTGFNVVGLMAIQVESVLLGIVLYLRAAKTPFWVVRIGPAVATVNTTLAVILSGDSTSGFAMFYLWVGLYAFYFPISRREAGFYIAFAAAAYAFAIYVTPSGVNTAHADISHFVIAAGTLLTAGVLLTYLRSRVERLMGRLTDAARTDPLTGMPNRVALQQELERELERGEPEQRPISVMVVDIDRFKQVNAQHGISAGDEVLQRFGHVLEDSIRRLDTAFRSGGEEFIVLLPELREHEAFLSAEEVLSVLRGAFHRPGIEITASIGVASYPTHATDVEGLLTAADQAMYAAKALGRDRPVIYSPEVTATIGAAAGRRNVESQAQLATVLSLAEALDQRDSSTARHSQTVGRLCEAMARELGFDDDRVGRVRLAGILHDIGKIGVPDSILRKPGPLSDEEVAQMRRHPEIGARILSSHELDDVRAWVSAHHERPDGGGYPLGLTADEIPIEASILAVADAYEAMTCDRVYRPALGAEAAREELLEGSGTQFDPQVVTALLRAVEAETALQR